MYKAIARPRVRMSPNRSAYTPPTTVWGAAAMVPQMTRNTRSDGQLGAKAHATVPKKKTVNVQKRTNWRPTISLRNVSIQRIEYAYSNHEPQRRKDERSHAVTNEKNGSRENLLSIPRLIEVLHDSGDCIAWQGG